MEAAIRGDYHGCATRCYNHAYPDGLNCAAVWLCSFGNHKCKISDCDSSRKSSRAAKRETPDRLTYVSIHIGFTMCLCRQKYTLRQHPIADKPTCFAYYPAYNLFRQWVRDTQFLLIFQAKTERRAPTDRINYTPDNLHVRFGYVEGYTIVPEHIEISHELFSSAPGTEKGTPSYPNLLKCDTSCSLELRVRRRVHLRTRM